MPSALYSPEELSELAPSVYPPANVKGECDYLLLGWNAVDGGWCFLREYGDIASLQIDNTDRKDGKERGQSGTV